MHPSAPPLTKSELELVFETREETLL